MQGIMPTLLLLLLVVSVMLAGAEVVNPQQTLSFSNNDSSTAAALTQEEAKIESWSPSQPELTQMLAYPRNPQPLPTNYYPLAGNRFSPPVTNEYRSEHYSYPYEPSYPYPISQPSAIDSSLVPTSKHFVIVSFIGLLLLFAIIQNSIISAKRKDALVEILANRRRKRDVVASSTYNPMNPEVELALNEEARIRCIQRTLC